MLPLALAPSTAVAPAPEAQAAGRCLVNADSPHASRHELGRLNAIGWVRCSYNPAGALKLEVRVQRQNWLGGWYSVPTTRTILDHTSYYVRHSQSKGCVSGTYRTQARAYAVGPRGEAARWSLWAPASSAPSHAVGMVAEEAAAGRCLRSRITRTEGRPCDDAHDRSGHL